jgi:hypothetical protein
MEQLLVGLLLWISQHSAFEYHPDMGLPIVQSVSQIELAELYVGKDSDEKAQGFLSDTAKEAAYKQLAASLEAVYAADKNTIYLGTRIDPNSAYGRAVVVHELIHFLQKVNKHETKVACSNALEKDAYTIQAKYMKAHKLIPSFNEFTVLMRSICEEGL